MRIKSDCSLEKTIPPSKMIILKTNVKNIFGVKLASSLSLLIGGLTNLLSPPSDSQGRTASRCSTLPSNSPTSFTRFFKFDYKLAGKVEVREAVLPWESEGRESRKLPLKFSLIIFCLLTITQLTAQDIHFSQNTFSPLNLNPSLAGSMKEDVRIMGSYRSQWQSVPVSYLTFSGGVDMKLPQVFSKNKKLQLSAGALFNQDEAGDSKLSLSSIGLVGSIAYLINDYNSISVGVQSSVVQRNFSMSGLTFKNQFNGDIFNPALDSRENFSNDNFSFVDIGVGLNWRYFKPGTENFGNFGFSVLHVNQPDQTFDNDTDAQLPMKIIMYSLGEVEFHPKWDGVIRAVGSIQGGYGELLVGLGTRYHLSKKRGSELAVQFNTFYRVDDAIIPSFEVHYGSFNVGISYDINTSQFQEATNRNGGLELGIIYTITNVKSVDVFESCPVF